MLFVLIPSAWLAIVAFVVIMCRAAARGDAALAAATLAAEQRHGRTGARGAIGARARWQDLPHIAGARGVGAKSDVGVVRVRGVRGRGGRCVAGS